VAAEVVRAAHGYLSEGRGGFLGAALAKVPPPGASGGAALCSATTTSLFDCAGCDNGAVRQSAPMRLDFRLQSVIMTGANV
jgi:hypothetical protein